MSGTVVATSVFTLMYNDHCTVKKIKISDGVVAKLVEPVWALRTVPRKL
jgi:hypothetical protein